MNECGDVKGPPGQDVGRHIREPQHETASADDSHTPEHRPIVKFLPVSPAVKDRPRPLTEEPLEHGNHVSQILHARHQRGRPEPIERFPIPAYANREINQLREKYSYN